MRPVEFPPEAIVAAGKALQAEGRPITSFALRERVGGGNPKRLMQVWAEHLLSELGVPAEPVAELPVEVARSVETTGKELADRLTRLAIELNDRALKAAEKRVTEIMRGADEQREQAERELADAARSVEAMEAKLDAEAAARQVLDAQLAEANKALANAREESAHLRGQLEATKAQQDAIMRELHALKEAQTYKPAKPAHSGKGT